MVRPVNDSPLVVLSLGDRGLAIGSRVDLDLGAGFRDPDPTDSLRYSVTLTNALGESGAWLSVQDGHLVGTPNLADRGAWDVQIRAIDPQGQESSQSLRWVVGEANQAPAVLSTAPARIEVRQNDVLTIDLASLFNDPDLGSDQQLTYLVRSATPGSDERLASVLASLGSGQQLSLPTDNGMVGSRELIIRASDPQGLAAEHRLQVVITNVNDAPTVQRATAVAQGAGLWEERFALTPATPLTLDLANLFTDPDQLLGQAAPVISIRNDTGASAAPLPAWLSWDAESGQLVAAPGAGAGGRYAIALEATDPAGSTAVYRLLLDVNSPPTPTSGTALEQRFYTGNGLSLALESLFSDPDRGDKLAFSASLNRLQLEPNGSWREESQPLEASWLSLAPDASSGASVLTLSPNRGEAGRYRLHLQATDLQGASSSETVELEVIATNSAPQVTRQAAAIVSADHQGLSLNLAELFADLDISQPVAADFAASGLESLRFSYALINGDQDWVTTTLAGNPRPINAINLRDSSSSDGLVNDLLSLDLPGVDRTLHTTLRLFATDASGSQASQEVSLTITPRVELPLLAALTAPNSLGQRDQLRLGQLFSELPQLIDAEGDRLSLGIRTLPGVQIRLPEGFLGWLEDTAVTAIQLDDGRSVTTQGWLLHLSSVDPQHDLALLPEVSLQLAPDHGLLLPQSGQAPGTAVIGLPVELRLEASVTPASSGSAQDTLPIAVGSPQLSWIPIENQAPVFDWGGASRFVSLETGSQPQGLLADLTALFGDPDSEAGSQAGGEAGSQAGSQTNAASGTSGDGSPVDSSPGQAAAGLQWQLSLPSRLEGLIELDQASGSLRWKAGTTLTPELVGSHRILISAFDGHYALGDSSAIARGVLQLFVKAPGAPASSMEDLITRLQTLPSVNGGRSWSLLQPTDANSSDKNVLATSELFSGDLSFLAPAAAIAALPSGLSLASNRAESGFDPIDYSLATDQPGGWYSLVDFAIAEQAAAGLVVMKGYDADHNTITTELAYRQYHSQFLSFDATAQLNYGGDFGLWLQDQQFTISRYTSDEPIRLASESELQNVDFVNGLVAALPQETGLLLGDRIAADGSALLIDSNGDGKVDFIRLLLIDNGLFDLDPTVGQLRDPLALLPVHQEALLDQLAGTKALPLFAFELKNQLPVDSFPALESGAGDQGLIGLPVATELPSELPEALVSADLGDEGYRGPDGSLEGLGDAAVEQSEKLTDLLAVEPQDVLESSKETLENVADSIKESLSKLLGKNDVVSSKLLAGLLAPAGGTSLLEQLLGKISTGGSHRLVQRDRNLRGRWRLAGTRRVLTLADGRLRLSELADPSETPLLEGFPAGDDPTLASLASGRLLDLVRRSPAPAQALALIQLQLRGLLQGTTPVNWPAWLQALPAVLANRSPLEGWRSRNSLKHLQVELVRLGELDPALMDVLMASELVTCLEAFGLDGLASVEPRGEQTGLGGPEAALGRSDRIVFKR